MKTQTMEFSFIALILLTFSLGCLGTEKPSIKLHTVNLKEGDSALTARFRLNSTTKAGIIKIISDKKKSFQFKVEVRPEKYRGIEKKNGKKIKTTFKLPDAAINFSGLVHYYVRPRIQRYKSNKQDNQRLKLKEKWNTLPAASKTFVKFEVRQVNGGVEIFLNGRYAGRRDFKGRLQCLSFSLPEEGETIEMKSFQYYENQSFFPLEIKYIAKPGEMNNADLSLKPGLHKVADIPFILGGGGDNVDVGVVKQMKGSWALECDEFLSRTAFDGMPETAHFSVPLAYYVKAWALCAVEPTSHKDPIITARLTRYSTSGRSEAIADTTVRLPLKGEKSGAGVEKVGVIVYEKNGKRIEIPLYKVEFKLPTGDILDLLTMRKDRHASMSRSQSYLDFEFLGKMAGVSAQWDSRRKPDNFSTSGVHVFAATLERSPVELRLVQERPGNIFHNDEKPETRAVLKSLKPCEIVFGWRIYDVAGKTLKEKYKSLNFSSADMEREVKVDLTIDKLGWYGIDFSILNSKSAPILKHSAAFALLGKNTRKAGYESPYGTWWFAGAHYGCGDPKIIGPMLFKAGLRKTTFGWSKHSEKDFAPWKVTLNQLSKRYMPKFSIEKKKSWDAAEKKISEILKRFPHCKYANIFHESYRSYVPAELKDEKEVEDEKTKKKNKKMVETATFACEFYRQRFPNIKLLVGNTTSSASLIAALLRNGFDPKYIDYIGMETVGQTCMPEKLWDGGIQGIWLGREAARKFGCDLPVTGCYEFTARTDRNLGSQCQAEYIARDMLLCHAYKFDNINPAIIHDAGNSYFNTLWGAGGLCRRNPLLYPKPAFVAVATLTKVLDQVKCIRRVPTGSFTVYALEFKRADGKFVYAVWNARGVADLSFKFPKSVKVDIVGFYGATEKRSTDMLGWGKSMTIKSWTAPKYIVSPITLDSISIIKREYAPPPKSFRVAEPMNDIKKWRLLSCDTSLSNPTASNLPIRRLGDFAFSQVNDTEKGDCLQLKLKKKGTLSDIVSEYTVIKLKKSVAVSGKPTDIGLLVKGDSGWGKIIFEIQDATGALWRTEGMFHDWPGDLSICHDDWRFMSFPIDNSSKKRNLSAGGRWNSNSPLSRKTRYADKSKTIVTPGFTITFPIKIVGLYVVLNRKSLDLTKMKDAECVVRLKNIGTFQEEEMR